MPEGGRIPPTNEWSNFSATFTSKRVLVLLRKKNRKEKLDTLRSKYKNKIRVL